ncbi:MAG: DUF3617 domain-containing protein [Burkholderiaceae bacterium]
MQTRRIGILLTLLGAACGASAQNLKPGLWEISQKMQSASGEMESAMAEVQKQMAAMTPEHRKSMQEMMAKQGVRMGSSGAGSMSVKVCMTKEMVERNEVAPQRGDCKSTSAPRVGNSMKLSFVCTKPPSSGEGQITFVSPESYTSKMTVHTSASGKSETVAMDGQGKWLAVECGAIKASGTGKP